MCTTVNDTSYVMMGRPSRIWTVPAIHGDLKALITVHDALLKKFKAGDRILYHGNYTGFGEQSAQCVTEILTFRRMVLAISGVRPSDFIYLRGRQEEIWQKLLQLQFAPDPTNVLLWMLGNGISSTLYSYGISPHDGIEACRYGIMDITRWTNKIREAVRAQPGHETFAHQMKRAAHTDETSAYPMLFVHAGLKAEYALQDQGDHLWWGAHEFDCIQSAYKPFEKVVRGFDPEHRGLHLNCITATVDDGCGFGGHLVSVGFEADGGVAAILHA